MKRYEKIMERVANKTLNAGMSSIALSLIRKTESQVKELEQIESSLVDSIRDVQRQGAGRDVKEGLVSAIGEVREAQSKLLDAVAQIRVWATDIEMGFLT